ncbi:MAG: 7-carboxy-7-deazaguanine synthase QueE [Symploca sp. SIO2B6]|nr:7-carboxy-7-deazaguanine synthase QueE [Symploca sp. SIO2B6]
MSIFFPIHETFQQSLQGEGALAGTPVDFIRLQGCPVGCWFCDTGYSADDDYGRHAPRTPMSMEQLLAELRSPRVVISGGEPFIHSQLPQLVAAIEQSDRHVSIETSGAKWHPISSTAWITLSPKTHINAKFPVQPNVWHRADEIKLVISSGQEWGFYRPELERVTCPIFLQPEWTHYAHTLPLTLQLLQEYSHCRLSVQLHKLIGVP